MSRTDSGGFPGYPATPPATPPTAPGPLPVYTAPSKWPTVIGVIAIVFGVFGALGGVWGALSPLFIDMVFGSTATPLPPQAAAQLEIQREWAGWTVGLSIAGGLLAVLLLIAGIGLTMRRAWCAGTARTWAWLKIAFAFVNTYVAYRVATETMPLALKAAGGTATAPALPPAAVAAFTDVVAVISVVFGLAWGLALPVFVLIWFGRSKIRAEMSTWRIATR
jgi:hypothetical protein